MGHHDALFKRVFSIPEHAAGELRSVLSPSLLDRLELDQLRLVTGSFIDAALEDRHADLLFHVPLRNGGSTFVYMLFEHQSEPDPMMPLRLLVYMTRIWEQHVRTYDAAHALPPIVSVLVHNGAQGWKPARAFHELVRGLDEAPELAAFVPRFDFVLDDLVTQSDDALKSRPLAMFARLALWLLRDARRGSAFAAAVAAWAESLDLLARDPARRADVQTLLMYAHEVAATEHFEEVRTALTGKAPYVEDAMQTMYEFLIEKGKVEGRAEGKVEGRAEGKVEGRAEGKRQLLERLIVAKLGALPDHVRARLASAEDAELERLSDSVLTAHSFDDLVA